MSRHLAKRLDEIARKSRSGDKQFVVLRERAPDFAMKFEEAKRNRQLIVKIVSFGQIGDAR